jgi:glutamate racemase
VIGVFDSGVGGLSVWREMAKLMPAESYVYLADQAHVPYGARELDDVRALTTDCIGWLLRRGCDMIVIACNTASAAALSHVRVLFPHTPFVGMEPAVKPAASHTHTGVIGVLATQATFHSQVFASVVMRFASNVQVIEQPCPGWVELVEHGTQASPACHPLVDHYVLPLLDKGADTLVLGCTHFPFLASAIECSIASWKAQHHVTYDIELVDPSHAVARQAMRVRNQHGLGAPAIAESRVQFWTTGDAAAFSAVSRRLLPNQLDFPAATVPFSDIRAVPAALSH